MNEKELALKILEYLGGSSNINSVFNCYTRVRAEVKNTKLVKTKEIKALGVIGVVISGSQVQIVVGPGKSAKCSQAINEALEKSGVKTETPKNQKGAKGGLLKKISGIFVPIIPATIACGLVMAIIEVVKAATGGPNSTFTDAGIGLILNIIASSVFTVFNFIVGYNTCKQFGGDGIIGACLAAIISSPLLGTVDAPTSFGPFVVYGGLGGIIAVVFAAIGVAYFEKLLRKFMPNIIDAFMTPLISLLVVGTVTIFLIQPLCGYISKGIGLGVEGIIKHCPYLLGIVPMFYLPMVLFGVHHTLMPISQSLIDNPSLGYSVLVPIQLMAGAAQVGAAIYFIISTRNKKARTTVIQGLPVGVLGIGEPLIYGMTLPLKRLFIPIGIAGAIAGGVMSLLDVRSPVAEATGIEASLVFTGDGKWKFALVYLGAVILGFIMAALIGYKETYEENQNGVLVEKTHESSLVLKYWGFWKKDKPQKQKAIVETKESTYQIYSPLKGKVVKLETLKDKTFSQKIMGDGIAIIPSEGKVYSPVDGKISALLDTKHAYGITTDEGYELLVHIGIDTVNLKGKGFKTNVKEGDKVKKGQLLGTFDIAFIKKKGYSIATPIIVVSGEKITKKAKLGNITSKASLLTISK